MNKHVLLILLCPLYVLLITMTSKYRDFIVSITNNEFLQFCKSVAIYEALKKDHIKRLELLKKCNILENPLYPQ